jgi:hypothetical protein
MARHESDREDLMREATALRERVELQYADELFPVVAGFREDGRISLFFGSDPAFHFDPDGRLRRAFVDGELYRSRGDTLSRLTRSRTAAATDLIRHDLTTPELQTFVLGMQKRLQGLIGALEAEQATVLRQVPEGVNLVARLRQNLARTLNAPLAPALKK